MNKLSANNNYYRKDLPGWRFLFLDGNELSLYRWPAGSAEQTESQRYYQTHHQGKPKWNGAIGAAQMAWLNDQLTDAKKSDDRIIIFCHFPLVPNERHNLWNADEVLSLLQQSPNVVAWINGHNHAGHYQQLEGIHFVTLNAMLDTEETAWAVMELHPGRIDIKGRGKQNSLSLKVSNSL